MRPPFKELPLDKAHPPHSAWIHGETDSLGTFNDITNDSIVKAYSELRSGSRVCLNWSMDHPRHPSFNRLGLSHKIIKLPGRCVCDDELHFNTQHSSQWDGLRHFGYQSRKIKSVLYNNTQPEDFLDGKTSIGNKGIGEVAKLGIVARGVLLDVYGYVHDVLKESYDPWSTHQIPFKTVQDCIVHQKVEIKRGDILIIRTGYHVVYNAKSDDQILEKSQSPPGYAGVAQDIAMAEWLWDSGIIAVAGDAPAFESWPPNPSIEENPKSGGFMLHEILLGGMGMSIGEMWYLENLLEICRKEERWSFMVTSSPLNVPGGIASPPQVMCLF